MNQSEEEVIDINFHEPPIVNFSAENEFPFPITQKYADEILLSEDNTFNSSSSILQSDETCVNEVLEETLNSPIFLSAYWRFTLEDSKAETIIFESRTGYGFKVLFIRKTKKKKFFSFEIKPYDSTSKFLYTKDCFNPSIKISNGKITQNFEVKFNCPNLIFFPGEYDKGFIITITVGIKHLRAKKHGIINEGATCYANSVIQLLYHIPLFKHTILNLPKEVVEENKRLFELKKIFYQLKNKPSKSISCKQLLHLLGKNEFIQTDIQEFFMDLIESLKLSKYSIEMFNYLFEGSLKTSINCKTVNFKSEKTEQFFDIQLSLKGNNINTSLFFFLGDEEMIGNNRYLAGVHGLQDAVKTTKFKKLPKILMIQLKRFEYNCKTQKTEKINDKFRYTGTLRLKEDPNHEVVFTLRGVVVHCGSLEFGHYYYYGRNKEGEWYIYNDDDVSRVYPYEVFDNNFGGDSLWYLYQREKKRFTPIKQPSAPSAYLLVYSRNEFFDEIYNLKFPVYIICKENLIGTKEFSAFQDIEKKYPCIMAHIDNSVNDVINKVQEITSLGKNNFEIFLLNFQKDKGNIKFKYIKRQNFHKIKIGSLIAIDESIVLFFFCEKNIALTKFDEVTKKWTFRENIISEFSPIRNEEKAKEEVLKKLLIVKYPVIQEKFGKIKIDLYINNIYEIAENSKYPFSVEELEEIFFSKYYSNWECKAKFSLKSPGENEINLIMESSLEKEEKYTKDTDLKKIENDAISVIYNSSSIKTINYIKVNKKSYSSLIEIIKQFSK